MRTFAELLREYIGRTGVSDAELARAIGVQRQTVFRWKEGLVARPRSAEEVLHLAAKLRLTPAERDELLLAAGFPPVAAPSHPEPAADSHSAPAEPPATRVPPPVRGALPIAVTPVPTRRRPTRAVLLGLIALLAVVAAAFALTRPRVQYPRAAAGETLVVIAQFGNYTGGNQGYNVAGRLHEALTRELAAAGLKDARAAAWPAAITDQGAAVRALADSEAALLIWGEYDSGRVVARFLPRTNLAAASRELSLLAATPAELPTVINSALPGDIRYLALYSLAQIYLHENQAERARAALGQAGLNLPADADTRAGHYFLWGYANQIADPPDLDAAIQGYTEALKLDAGLDAAHNNRAVSYLRRRGPGDLIGAVDDLTYYLTKHADDPAAYNNRGTAYFLLGGPEPTRQALADFDRAVTLAPGDGVGYYNRGLVYVRLNEGAGWRADLQAALAAGYAGAAEGLCWGYALSEAPAQAISYCQDALKAAAGAGPWENLGVAYARIGQYAEAAAALTRYRESLTASPQASAAKLARLEAWVRALQAGANPIDGAAIQALREE